MYPDNKNPTQSTSVNSSMNLSKQTTNDSSRTLVANERPEKEQDPKGSALSRFGKRVVDGYNKKALKTNVPVEMLYRNYA
ncbi:MAG: hypothetical protein NXY57DRAFT_960306 [Lentinula lateritia]|uniref:Uncharacterized protein n=1 Tax=Lentinula lateritia TaxID=40482 RepID=A0ABQ8VS38_9AGAR|nr:MAG: hypothetical protein NXY57DRAFT_960306 [Lentinula lateritia]KAJ4499164.1 hypothetical protein C8R41DRAFT_915816 [Lentinula lateritia]